MDLKRDEMTAGVDRLTGLLGWWDVQGTHAIESRIKSFRELASGLQQAYSEAYSDQLQGLNATNDRVSRSLRGLLQSRKSGELFAAQADILAALLESASHHVTTWSELGKKIQNCYAEVARETAEDMRNQSQEAAAKAGETVREEQHRARRVKEAAGT